MPTFDVQQLLEALTLKANIGPLQWAVIGATILVVRWLKMQPDIPTPKKARPLLYFAVGLTLNLALEFVLDQLSLRTLVAEQVMVWVTTLGLRHLIDAPKAVDPPVIHDTRPGRMGDERRP